MPYKGSTLAHPDLMSGRVSLMLDTLTATTAQVKAGGLKAYAVTTATRASTLPNVPTMAEAGLPGDETSTWGGCWRRPARPSRWSPSWRPKSRGGAAHLRTTRSRG